MTDYDKLRGWIRVIASYAGSDAGDAATKELRGAFDELEAQLLATQRDRHAIMAERDALRLAARQSSELRDAVERWRALSDAEREAILFSLITTTTSAEALNIARSLLRAASAPNSASDAKEGT